MAFLSPDWLDDLNQRLARHAGPELTSRRVLLVIPDAPEGPLALALSLGAQSARVERADASSEAAARLTLSYEDARQLAGGALTSAEALRRGRVKVLGDVEAIVEALEFLLGAHGPA